MTLGEPLVSSGLSSRKSVRLTVDTPQAVYGDAIPQDIAPQPFWHSPFHVLAGQLTATAYPDGPVLQRGLASLQAAVDKGSLVMWIWESEDRLGANVHQ